MTMKIVQIELKIAKVSSKFCQIQTVFSKRFFAQVVKFRQIGNKQTSSTSLLKSKARLLLKMQKY